MAVTAAGTPYVESSDNVADYPGTSLALANHIDGLDGGKVLQVVSVTKTDSFSMQSATYADITGMSVTITPTLTSSKIMVMVAMQCGSQHNSYWSLLRGSTDIALGDAAGSRVRASAVYPNQLSGNAMTGIIMNFLDSPATVSATTYKIQARGQYGSTVIGVNRSESDANSSDAARAVSTITVMEIGA
jgi:hypothetical protein